MQTQGALGGLIGNPAGPFSSASMKGLAITAGGVGLGLVLSNLVDRYVATRTPEDGNNPWYGSAAAAAQARRPDAMRLGAQAGLTVASMALTYWTRSGRVLPWLFAGTTVGAAAGIVQKLVDWWVMPTLLEVKDPNEESLANRLYPVEQSSVQDEVAKIFENLSTPVLSGGQAETPTIQGVLSPGMVYSLGDPAGKGRSSSGREQPKSLSGQTGKPDFIRTGRLGECPSCGGNGGCWSTCAQLDDDCIPCRTGANGVGGMIYEGKRCYHKVGVGENLEQLAALGRIDLQVLSEMNGGLPPSEFWQPGNKVVCPYAMCTFLNEQGSGEIPASSPVTTADMASMNVGQPSADDNGNLKGQALVSALLHHSDDVDDDAAYA